MAKNGGEMQKIVAILGIFSIIGEKKIFRLKKHKGAFMTQENILWQDTNCLMQNTPVVPLNNQQMADNNLVEKWGHICAHLEKELGDKFALRWLKRIKPSHIENNIIYLSTPTPCIHELIKQNYAQPILSYWQQENPDILDLSLELQEQASKTPQKQEQQLLPIPTIQNTSDMDIDGEVIPSFLNANNTFDNFVVGQPNEFAFAAAKRVAEDVSISFNPLYIHAPAGLGKTHLIHAIAWKLKELQPDKTVLYLSSEQFLTHFLKTLHKKGTTDAFRAIFKKTDTLIIDDMQFIFGKKATQDEFFHIFNSYLAQGKKIILSSDSNPLEMQGVEDRFKTRIAQGLVVHIQQTSYDLRLGILQEKVKTIKTKVPNDVLMFLAKNITASVRELEGALKRIVARAELIGTPINIDTTKEALMDMLQVYEKTVTVPDIQQAVATYYNISLSDLKSTRRDRCIVRPRQMAMYIAKNITNLSLPDIGIHFGRDHTTIMHSIKTIDNLLKRDATLNKDKTTLISQLKEGTNGTA